MKATLSKISSFVIEEGKRIFKVRQYGTKTAKQVAPFGDDSNPLPETTAIFLETEESGEPVIIGFIDKNKIAAIGEKRIYSTDSNGDVVFSIHLKNDGTCEIGGNSDNMVRFAPLDQAMVDFNTFLNAELVKIATGISGAGGAYTPGTSNIDISASKIDEIKTL